MLMIVLKTLVKNSIKESFYGFFFFKKIKVMSKLFLTKFLTSVLWALINISQKLKIVI